MNLLESDGLSVVYKDKTYRFQFNITERHDKKMDKDISGIGSLHYCDLCLAKKKEWLNEDKVKVYFFLNIRNFVLQ